MEGLEILRSLGPIIVLFGLWWWVAKLHSDIDNLIIDMATQLDIDNLTIGMAAQLDINISNLEAMQSLHERLEGLENK